MPTKKSLTINISPDVQARAGLFFEPEKIQERILAMAKEIDSLNLPKLHLIVVLKGAAYFATDLSKALETNHSIDFMQVSSYEGTESSGYITLKKDIENEIAGKNILLVEDIVDTGRSIDFLFSHLNSKAPKSVRVATLLLKPDVYSGNHTIEHVGFEVANNFYIGYGMDLNEQYRSLAGIYTVEQ